MAFHNNNIGLFHDDALMDALVSLVDNSQARDYNAMTNEVVAPVFDEQNVRSLLHGAIGAHRTSRPIRVDGDGDERVFTEIELLNLIIGALIAHRSLAAEDAETERRNMRLIANYIHQEWAEKRLDGQAIHNHLNQNINLKDLRRIYMERELSLAIPRLAKQTIVDIQKLKYKVNTTFLLSQNTLQALDARRKAADKLAYANTHGGDVLGAQHECIKAFIVWAVSRDQENIVIPDISAIPFPLDFHEIFEQWFRSEFVPPNPEPVAELSPPVTEAGRQAREAALGNLVVARHIGQFLNANDRFQAEQVCQKWKENFAGLNDRMESASFCIGKFFLDNKHCPPEDDPNTYFSNDQKTMNEYLKRHTENKRMRKVKLISFQIDETTLSSIPADNLTHLSLINCHDPRSQFNNLSRFANLTHFFSDANFTHVSAHIEMAAHLPQLISLVALNINRVVNRVSPLANLAQFRELTLTHAIIHPEEWERLFQTARANRTLQRWTKLNLKNSPILDLTGQIALMIFESTPALKELKLEFNFERPSADIDEDTIRWPDLMVPAAAANLEKLVIKCEAHGKAFFGKQNMDAFLYACPLMRRLKHLSLIQTRNSPTRVEQMSDECLPRLIRLVPNLEVLKLHSHYLLGDNLAHIGNLKQLQYLCFYEMNLAHTALMAIVTGCEKLTKLLIRYDESANLTHADEWYDMVLRQLTKPLFRPHAENEFADEYTKNWIYGTLSAQLDVLYQRGPTTPVSAHTLASIVDYFRAHPERTPLTLEISNYKLTMDEMRLLGEQPDNLHLRLYYKRFNYY